MHAGALSQAATRERLIKARVQIVASSSEPIRSAGIDRSRLFADVSGENLQHDALDRQAGVSISADEFLEELQNEPSDPPGPAFDRLPPNSRRRSSHSAPSSILKEATGSCPNDCECGSPGDERPASQARKRGPSANCFRHRFPCVLDRSMRARASDAVDYCGRGIRHRQE